MAIRFGGRIADAGWDFAGASFGGLAGLSGPLPTLWGACAAGARISGARVPAFQRHRARRIAVACRSPTVFVKQEVFWLALLALPGTLVGARLGARTYQALERPEFLRRRARACWFLSGVGLVWSSIGTL